MDELTLRRAQQGDAAAFERLMTPLEGMVWRVCYHYTGHREDAADCAQEAMVKAWRSLPQYRQDCSLETWLYRVCTSCCLDFLRRRKPDVSLTNMAEQGFDLPDAAPTPEEAALRREDEDEVRRAIALLPEDMRTVLILCVLEQKRYEDVAAITGVAVGTVKSRLNRARLRLSEILARLREPSAFSSVQPDERRTQHDL